VRREIVFNLNLRSRNPLKVQKLLEGVSSLLVASLKRLLTTIPLTLCPGLFCLTAVAQNPVQVGSWPGFQRGQFLGIAVQGSHAYAATGDAGLQIFNVSNPAAPVRVGGYNTTGYALGVVVSGSYAYIADYDAGLQVIEVSNPAAPVRVGGYDTPDLTYAVAVSGNYAYVADYNSGLHIIDVSNPAAPVRVGGYNTPDQAKGVAVSGNYAYVADDDAGLQVIDVSNPASPTLAGGHATTGDANAVAVVGNFAYIAGDVAGLLVIDVSNPATPFQVGLAGTGGYAVGVAVAGNHAYVADDTTGLVVFGVSDPASPTEASRLGAMGNTSGVAISGSYAYVADYNAGLQVINVSNAAAPARVGGFSRGDTSGVAVAGNYAYVAQGSSGLQVIDVSNPVAPVRVGGYTTSDYISRVVVSGARAYVTADDAGFQVIDVSNPAAPVQLGVYQTTNDPVGVAVSGRYAYVTYEVGGLEIIDVGNPATPVRVGSYPTSDSAYGVAIIGNYLYVADGDTGLVVLDVSNPAAPVLMGSFDTAGWAAGVAISDNQVYIADSDWGLAILNFTPASTLLALSWPTPTNAFALERAPRVTGPWAAVPGIIQQTNGQNRLVVPGAGSAGFFRLQPAFGQAKLLEPPISTPNGRERGPSLSSDGLALYHSSDVLRPVVGGAGDMDLWVVTRVSAGNPWGAPSNVAAINTTGNEAFPAISADGLSLFFTDWFQGFGVPRTGSFGNGDLWVSTRASAQSPWPTPINLGPTVNSAFVEATPSISADGLTLIFMSDRLGNVPGSGSGRNAMDFWITTRTNAADPTGWSAPVNLGAVVNSIYADESPNLSHNGLALYFTSNRPTPGRPSGNYDLWVAKRNSASEPFGAPQSLGMHFMNFRPVFDPYLSADGTELFFSSTGLLSNPSPTGDLWQVTTLTPPPLFISLPSQP